jgi:trehalose-phosphatase
VRRSYLTMDESEAVDLLVREPTRTGLFCDFDGTLSEIVSRPEDATPVTGADEVLAELAQHFALVAIVSGRSLDDLRTRLQPRGVVLAGSYGRERSDGDATQQVVGWDGVVERAEERTARWDGVVVEAKDAGVALHYRNASDRERDVSEVAAVIAHEFGLQVRPGRLVYELVVPGPGKAEAIVGLVQEYGVRTALVAGDDVADLEAFEAVRSLDVQPNVRTVIVAIASDEAPAELERSADLVVAGPKEFVVFLRRVAEVPRA